MSMYVHGDHEFAQSIGERRAYQLLGRQLQSGGHNPARRYSIGRTTAWLALRYVVGQTGFAALCVARLGYEAVGIVMAESDRLRKLSALCRGAAVGLLRGAWPAGRGAAR
jgi:hypothetical protein